MTRFFTLIYLIPNRFSGEKIPVALLANINGIPRFAVCERKLNYGLTHFSPALRAEIKKGFRYMDHDVNKIVRGEVALSLFEPPYAKKLLKELSTRKRGVVQYSDLFEVAVDSSTSSLKEKKVFEKLYKKFFGEAFEAKTVKKKVPNFKIRFKEYVTSKKFGEFSHNYKLKATDFPFIYKDMSVDLLRKSNYYTVFYTIDFSKSIQTIQTNVSRFRIIVQSLQQVSAREGLSSGRYYMVYESTAGREKQDLINTIKNERNLGYEIIRITEMTDKI